MRLVVTGAAGYIGARMVAAARARGHEVIAASRRRPDGGEAGWILFDLGSKETLQLPAGTDALIHLAANTQASSALDCESEINAARSIQESTVAAGAKFIFVSSQSARADAPTLYGRTKWKIEEAVRSTAWIVRPGQVYGGVPNGLFGTLVQSVRRMKLLPAFIPAPYVQPIHVDDLVEAILRIVERQDEAPRISCLAAATPVSFNEFLAEIGRVRIRRRRIFVPVPIAFLNVVMRILGEKRVERLGIKRLSSLFDLRVMKTAADLERLGLTLRALEAGMHPSGNDRRRRLLREARSLMRYLTGKMPTGSLARRYIRAVEALRGGDPLNLPKIFLGAPLLLAVIDGRSLLAGSELEWRLDAATTLLEATPREAPHFLGRPGAGTFMGGGLAIGWALLGEIFWRIPRVAAYPILSRIVARADDR
jgi:nucleoside-diphosphate-sugar epimerase